MGWEYRPNGVGIWQSMPSPTTSLDSAVTLVPEGWFLETLSDIFGDGMVYARLACPEPLREAQGCGGRTRALTLTAAALRARAANS